MRKGRHFQARQCRGMPQYKVGRYDRAIKFALTPTLSTDNDEAGAAPGQDRHAGVRPTGRSRCACLSVRSDEVVAEWTGHRGPGRQWGARGNALPSRMHRRTSDRHPSPGSVRPRPGCRSGRVVTWSADRSHRTIALRPGVHGPPTGLGRSTSPRSWGQLGRSRSARQGFGGRSAPSHGGKDHETGGRLAADRGDR